METNRCAGWFPPGGRVLFPLFVIMHRLLIVLLASYLLGAGTPALQAQATLIILARHAEKAAATGDPGLTPQGEARAKALAEALAEVSLTAIITTQYQRTQLTAAPTASAKHLTPLIVATAKELKEHATAAAKAIDALPDGSAVLVIGHSNTLGAIIAALGGPAVDDLCDDEFSTLFTLERPGGGKGRPSLVRTRFGAAEPPEASACHQRTMKIE